MEDKARESFQAIWRKKHKKEDHPDRRNVDACAVPLMIVANKWDSIKDENNPLARDRLGLKALCQVLRFLAHQHGASLVFTSSKDKTLNKQFRSLLSVWKSKFYGAFVLNRHVDLHAIDATPARWRGDAGFSPRDRARRAASSPRNET